MLLASGTPHVNLFRLGWTRGFATPVFQYNSTSPNILEGLIFWISSAMGLADGWHIPEVSEDCYVSFDYPCTIYDAMGTCEKCNEEDMAFALSIVS